MTSQPTATTNVAEPTYTLDYIELEDGDGPIVCFRGRRLGASSSRREDGPSWQELHAYESAGGKIVLHEVWMRAFPDQTPWRRVRIFDSIDELFDDLRLTRLSRDLYRDMGLEEVRIF